jgi:competence protein ComEC
VHLEQLLKVLSPSLVLADGSNYTSDVERWAATCAQQKTPFHATAKKGAYKIVY